MVQYGPLSVRMTQVYAINRWLFLNLRGHSCIIQRSVFLSQDCPGCERQLPVKTGRVLMDEGSKISNSPSKWQCVKTGKYMNFCPLTTVSVCVCACVRACTCACVRACVCMQACVHACVRACMHACLHARMRACVAACMRARLYCSNHKYKLIAARTSLFITLEL